MTERTDVAPALLQRLRSLCLTLPEAVEEEAWVGTRWRVGTRTFAHVVAIAGGWPPAYARAAHTAGPATVLTFRASGEDLEALTAIGPPFFKPAWFRDIVGLVLDDHPDWAEVGELVTDSYLVMAPARLVAEVAAAFRSSGGG